MLDLRPRFEKAAKEVQNLTHRPDNDTLLQLYALFKQSTLGDASGKRPGFTDMVGRAKFDAWAKLRGQSRESAMRGYIDLVERLKKRF